jgi:predicted nucleotidyltransferase
VADPAIVDIVRQYLRNLAQQGIPARMGVIFGSYAVGHPHQWSDIDLVVVSRTFDGTFSRDAINSLWRVAARTDSRIEPIPCGERQWVEDEVTPIIEVARREGVQVLPDGDSDGGTPQTYGQRQTL